MAPILVPELPGRTRSPSTHLRETLTSSPHLFLQPTRSLYNTSLAYLKATLDPVAQALCTAQAERQRAQRVRQSRKRKRGGHDESSHVDTTVVGGDPLRIGAVHVQDFEVEQVWDQVRRVLHSLRAETEGDVERLKRHVDRMAGDDDDLDGVMVSEGPGLDTEEENETGAGSNLEESLSEDERAELLDDPEAATDDDDDDDDDDQGTEPDDEVDERDEGRREYQADPHGLNDGFFSIDDFNKRSTLLEQADARGEAEDEDSDEEIDFTADPMAAGVEASKRDANKSGGSRSKKNGDREDSEDEGPTFGDMDLDGPEGDSDGDLDDIHETEEADGDDDAAANTNQIMYADFFAPPPQKARKNKKGRPNPHNFPAGTRQTSGPAPGDTDGSVDAAEEERTMDAVHRDLFEDDSGSGDDAGMDGDDLAPDPSDPKSRRSNHERRQLALAAEIRKLEAANVAKRDWTLSGEARAADRPVNSLLEEDLDFERTGKPVTVVTAELSESIEELIKRRILAHDFQDLIRRRPDDLATGPGGAAGRGRQRDFELSDAKSKKSLAELYEDDHLRATDDNYLDPQVEKRSRAESEVLDLWRALCVDLDSLSSWNFRPRAPVPTLDVRVDAPAVSLEDARPSGAEAGSVATRLAPQELYRTGDGVDRASGETLTRGRTVVAREEMSRDEKRRRRRREKERMAKRSDVAAAGAGGKSDRTGKTANGRGDKRSKERDMLGQLKRGRVRVIGNKGEMRDVEGNKVAAGASQDDVRASALKL